MTSKELVLKALRFEEVPRVPVSVLDGNLWMLTQAGKSLQDFYDMPDEEAVDFTLKNYEKLRSDIVFTSAGCTAGLFEVMGGESDFSQVGAPSKLVRHGIKEPEELRGFDAHEVLAKLRQHPLYKQHMRRTALMHERLADEKLVMAFAIGPLTMASMFMSMQDLMGALYEDPELVQYAIDFGEVITRGLIDDQLAAGAEGVSMADPAASRDLISEATFEEIVLPRIIDVTKYVKEQGSLFMLHICGDTSMRVKQLLGSGIDIFSVDSIDLAAALATARGEFTIFGNLSPVNVLLNMTPEQVRKEADDRVATAGKTGGFILGTGCDVAPLTPMANLRAMMDAVFA